MKTILTLLLLGLALNANAERVDKTLKVDLDGDIRIEVIEGKVVIEGWDKPAVRVTGNVPDMDDFVFVSDGDETMIEVESEHGFWGRHKRGGYAKLTINVPHRSNIISEGASSSFVIAGIKGTVRTSTMSGDISLDGGVGKVHLESVSGDVVAINSQGKLTLESVSGDIEAKVKSDFFEAESVSGSIEASIGKADHVELQTISGDIEVDLSLIKGGELEADTVSGDIDLKFLNDKLDASFEIDTGPGGSVRNLITDDKQDSSFAFSGSMEFKVGKGSSSVEIETMSGTVRIDQ